MVVTPHSNGLRRNQYNFGRTDDCRILGDALKTWYPPRTVEIVFRKAKRYRLDDRVGPPLLVVPVNLQHVVGEPRAVRSAYAFAQAYALTNGTSPKSRKKWLYSYGSHYVENSHVHSSSFRVRVLNEACKLKHSHATSNLEC